ncbi:MAG TPA: hypothetical protein VGQ09_13000 [Chitinophagaceae bacterium]|jgi:hypothetical protein|nr:hypothetical protein [Chitinophagaceae bacterium]
MGKDHRGQPSGSNKQEGLGIKRDMPAENLKRNEEIREKYTKNEDDLAENVKQKHPNRNRNKKNATNAGGYRQ